MDAHQISTKPDPYAPFNLAQAYVVENTIYMSGQVALNFEGETVGAGDIAAQTRQALENIKAVLEAGGSGMNKVVKMTTYLTDMANSQEYAEIKNSFFGAPYPAETMVQVTALALPELLVEIDVTAMISGVRRPSLP
jgi:2-iminobutanoate/2-iminopropanoate deaminase